MPTQTEPSRTAEPPGAPLPSPSGYSVAYSANWAAAVRCPGPQFSAALPGCLPPTAPRSIGSRTTHRPYGQIGGRPPGGPAWRGVAPLDLPLPRCVCLHRRVPCARFPLERRSPPVLASLDPNRLQTPAPCLARHNPHGRYWPPPTPVPTASSIQASRQAPIGSNPPDCALAPHSTASPHHSIGSATHPT